MVDRHYKKVLVATMRITTNTTPETLSGDTSEYWLTHLVVVIAAGKRPASIPNLEAKPGSADGTATDRLWESRTPPQHTLSRRASSKRMGSFAYQAQPFLAGRARSSEESQRCGTMGLVS